jgi:hypothetical protein
MEEGQEVSSPPDDRDVPEPRPGQPLATARQISLHEQRGHIFGPLDLDLEVGGVTLLRAPASTPRIALLLALAGRMHLSSGSLEVLGHSDPRKIFQLSAVSCLREVDDIDPAVSVRNVVTELRRWAAPFFKWVPKADAAALEEICGETFGDVPLPQLDDFVENLPVAQQLLLKIALANFRKPPLLVVGRLDDVTSDDDQSIVLRRLVDLGKHQSVIVGGVNQPPAEWGIKIVDLRSMSAVPSFVATSQGSTR